MRRRQQQQLKAQQERAQETPFTVHILKDGKIVKESLNLSPEAQEKFKAAQDYAKEIRKGLQEGKALCLKCSRLFKSKHGLKVHRYHCSEKEKE